jgi:hypothetical protein
MHIPLHRINNLTSKGLLYLFAGSTVGALLILSTQVIIAVVFLPFFSSGVMSVLLLSFVTALTSLGAIGLYYVLCLALTENSSETIFTVSGSSFGPSALPFPFGAMGTVLFVLVSDKLFVGFAIGLHLFAVPGVMSAQQSATVIVAMIFGTLYLSTQVPSRLSMTLINYSPVSTDPVSHTDSVNLHSKLFDSLLRTKNYRGSNNKQNLYKEDKRCY